MPSPNLPPGFDLLDPDVCVKGLPVAELAELRKSAPIYWMDVPGGTGGFGDKGYWAITKHKDVKEISVRSDIFSSQQDCAIPVWPKEMTREQIDLQRNVMLNMDAPHHTRLRKIISRGFTPRAVGRLRDELDARAQNIAKTAAAAAPATSSSRSPASCRCRPSPVCWVFRRRTGTRSSAGPTR